ncbi:hypothetical protein MP228_008319 [Amoeboaphelidium protococcarum]|nr:hypothetical protein MP228_008319 [Amoeboaphelidium protococcarum]
MKAPVSTMAEDEDLSPKFLSDVEVLVEDEWTEYDLLQEEGLLDVYIRRLIHVKYSYVDQRRLNRYNLRLNDLDRDELYFCSKAVKLVLQDLLPALRQFAAAMVNLAQCGNVGLSIDLPWCQSARVDVVLKLSTCILCLELDQEEHQIQWYKLNTQGYQAVELYDSDVESARMLAVSQKVHLDD